MSMDKLLINTLRSVLVNSHKDTNPELTGFHEALSRKRKVGVILDVLSP